MQDRNVIIRGKREVAQGQLSSGFFHKYLRNESNPSLLWNVNGNVNERKSSFHTPLLLAKENNESCSQGKDDPVSSWWDTKNRAGFSGGNFLFPLFSLVTQEKYDHGELFPPVMSGLIQKNPKKLGSWTRGQYGWRFRRLSLSFSLSLSLSRSLSLSLSVVWYFEDHSFGCQEWKCGNKWVLFGLSNVILFFELPDLWGFLESKFIRCVLHQYHWLISWSVGWIGIRSVSNTKSMASSRPCRTRMKKADVMPWWNCLYSATWSKGAPPLHTKRHTETKHCQTERCFLEFNESRVCLCHKKDKKDKNVDMSGAVKFHVPCPRFLSHRKNPGANSFSLLSLANRMWNLCEGRTETRSQFTWSELTWQHDGIQHITVSIVLKKNGTTFTEAKMLVSAQTKNFLSFATYIISCFNFGCTLPDVKAMYVASSNGCTWGVCSIEQSRNREENVLSVINPRFEHRNALKYTKNYSVLLAFQEMVGSRVMHVVNVTNMRCIQENRVVYFGIYTFV